MAPPIAKLGSSAQQAAEALEQPDGDAAEDDRPVRLRLGNELDVRHGRMVAPEHQGELTISACGSLRGARARLRPSHLGQGAGWAADSRALRRADAAAFAVERTFGAAARAEPEAPEATSVARCSESSSRSRYLVTVAASPASSASRMPGRNCAAYPVLIPGA